MYYVQLRLWGRTEKTYVLGDDSIFSNCGTPATLDEVSEIQAELGAKLNMEKTVITRSKL